MANSFTNRQSFQRRTSCAVCGGEVLNPVVTVADTPVYQGCVDPDTLTGVTRADMDWHACAVCGSAQIVSMPDVELVYQGGHATGLGAVWEQHHRAFADFMQNNGVGSRILEVGGGAGHLAAASRGVGIHAPWTILEPNPVRTDPLAEGVVYARGFLGPGFQMDEPWDTVVMSHVFEHFYEPAAVLGGLSDAMKQGDRCFLAWPVLERWCEALLAGALNFEHNVFMSRATLVALFANAGLTLKANSAFEPFRTEFFAFEKAAERATVALPDPTATGGVEGGPVVKRYFERFQRLSHMVNDQLLSADPARTFLTPASIYSQLLLTTGLDRRSFAALLDSSSAKQGKVLFGYDLPILDSELVLSDLDEPVVVLNAGAHNSEIRRQMSKVNPATRFVDVGHMAGQIV